MGEARWLGQAVFCCAAEGDSYRVLQRAPVTNGNKDRFDVGPGPDNRADNFVARSQSCDFIVLQQTVRAFFSRGFFESAGQPALGTADGRSVEEQAQMCGQAETPGMRDALPVNDEDVRSVFQFLHRC